jgi:misacylated tRNA(Ala) deacylase
VPAPESERVFFGAEGCPLDVTELAYLQDVDSAYVRTFPAKVTALPPGGVVLDRTYFYPTGGGQMADAGQIALPDGARMEVTDVTKSGSAVVHRLGRGSRPTALTVGSAVEGTIDWNRRHRHMRLHTGQHLLSARAFSLGGLRTRRATMAGQGGTVDLEAAWPSTTPLVDLERDVNAFFERALQVRVVHVPRAEWEMAPAARSGLVAIAPQIDPVRVIEIDGIDRCPCGGTHVRNTAEVGRITLLDPVPIPGGATRLAFTLKEAERPIPPA